MDLTPLNERAADLFEKIRKIDLNGINISGHTREYLNRYIENSAFYAQAYSQLLKKAVKKLTRPVTESTIIDYGGGCGILSFLAREAGFGTVIYNDIFNLAVNDAKSLAKELDIRIDNFICGDAVDLVKEIENKSIGADIICSFDVVEHIYDLEKWIRTVSVLKRFTILFHTGANPVNPFIRWRLKKIHEIAELKGCKKNIRLNDTFLDNSFLNERQIIICEKYPHLGTEEINFLSVKSRGLIKEEIEKLAGEYISKGSVVYQIDHPTNTCDPYTGNWAERLIDLERLIIFTRNLNLKIAITGSYYCYSGRKLLNILKVLLNSLIFASGNRSLFLSPAITIEIEKEQI